jgi:hypothetical protein
VGEVDRGETKQCDCDMKNSTKRKRIPRAETIISERRFERFDPRRHPQAWRNQYFKDYVEIERWQRTSKGRIIENPKYTNAQFGVMITLASIRQPIALPPSAA